MLQGASSLNLVVEFRIKGVLLVFIVSYCTFITRSMFQFVMPYIIVFQIMSIKKLKTKISTLALDTFNILQNKIWNFFKLYVEVESEGDVDEAGMTVCIVGIKFCVRWWTVLWAKPT